MPRMTLAAIAVAIVAFTTQADARPKHHTHRQHVAHSATAAQPRAIIDVAALPAYFTQETRPEPRPMGRGHIAPVRSYDFAAGEQIIGGRPSGCPYQYCGCGARLYLGIADKRLNLAWNWTKYYYGATPVAVWRHHVAIIEKMTGLHTAVLRDYNSGRGLSRIHERSISGARIIGQTHWASK